LSSDTNDLYTVAGEMIVYHGVPKVTVLEVDGCQVGPLRYDPDWYGEQETAFYTEQPIPASAIKRTLETYTRDDYDPD
jgi:hypothetical protein